MLVVLVLLVLLVLLLCCDWTVTRMGLCSFVRGEYVLTAK